MKKYEDFKFKNAGEHAGQENRTLPDCRNAGNGMVYRTEISGAW